MRVSVESNFVDPLNNSLPFKIITGDTKLNNLASCAGVVASKIRTCYGGWRQRGLVSYSGRDLLGAASRGKTHRTFDWAGKETTFAAAYQMTEEALEIGLPEMRILHCFFAGR